MLFVFSVDKIRKNMKKRSDNHKEEDMPDWETLKEPVHYRESKDLNDGRNNKTENKGADKKIKLIKSVPVFTSFYSDASFEKTLHDIAKKCTEAQGENKGNHQREFLKIAQTKKVIFAAIYVVCSDN